MTFNDLGLHDHLIRAVTQLGFKNPTEIQEKVIPIFLENKRDLIGLAQTGTGKTAAFGLPLLQHINLNDNSTQGLVICPTRELCMQITKDLESYAVFLDNPKITAVYGGANIEEQIRKVRKGAHILVATPGRLLDLIKRKTVNLGTVKTVILDEADEMLNMGFKEDLDAILQKIPETKNTGLFSATMPKEVRRIAENYMTDPVEIVVGKRNSAAANIGHHYYMMKEKDRYFALKRILDFYPEIFSLVFCRTRHETGSIAEKLEKDGYNATPLHGDLSQAQRDSAMKRFRDRTVKILVATDVAARGLDVYDISHVINYNLPDDLEVYTHRSGRTARAGKSGISITLVNTRENHRISQLEKNLNIKIEHLQIPDAEEICEQQMYALMDKVARTPVDDEAINRYWPIIYKKLKKYPLEEIIQKFISAELNTFLDYYKNTGDLNAKKESDKNDRSSQRKPDKRKDAYNKNIKGGSKRLFINLGERQNMNKGALVRLICSETGITSDNIGQISILSGYSFFEVNEKVADKVMVKMKSGTYEGKRFAVDTSQEKSRTSNKRKKW
ncbi:MAG: DEAD/DEAH box helicase [Bacteroidetes bacterium]|nr:DEAD/DEAH box helicase [Bacteroidota bacterium]